MDMLITSVNKTGANQSISPKTRRPGPILSKSAGLGQIQLTWPICQPKFRQNTEIAKAIFFLQAGGLINC
jgi:hypothetical protein